MEIKINGCDPSDFLDPHRSPLATDTLEEIIIKTGRFNEDVYDDQQDILSGIHSFLDSDYVFLVREDTPITEMSREDKLCMRYGTYRRTMQTGVSHFNSFMVVNANVPEWELEIIWHKDILDNVKTIVDRDKIIKSIITDI